MGVDIGKKTRALLLLHLLLIQLGSPPALHCSYPTPAPALLLPCSYFTPGLHLPCSWPTPALLLLLLCPRSCPAPALLLPCSCPAPPWLLLLPYSCPPHFDSLHRHQHPKTFSAWREPLFMVTIGSLKILCSSYYDIRVNSIIVVANFSA